MFSASLREEESLKEKSNAMLIRTLQYMFMVICLLTASSAAVETGDGYVCSLQAENDFFGGGTDRHFTHGTRLSCLTEPIPWITAAAARLPWFDAGEVTAVRDGRIHARASISLGQNIYTPEDITAKEVIRNDRPYAGWLYLGFGLVANQGSERYDKIELNIGVVGPAAMAREVQRGWHSLFGLRMPQGWDHQLKNEPAVVIFYEQARRFSSGDILLGLDVDVIPHVGGALGNVFTYGAAGFTLRAGPALEKDFGPPRIRPSLPGAGYFMHAQGIVWYIFAGVESRAMLHNIFLDGNTFADSHSVDRNIWVGDLQAGAAIQMHSLRLTYTQILRTKEFKGQKSPDNFGSLSISYQF